MLNGRGTTTVQNAILDRKSESAGCSRKESPMKINQQQSRYWKQRSAQAMTLVEVLVAFAISGLVVAGIVAGYVYSIKSAERFSLSLAANAQATERMEQIRSAIWNISSSPPIDQVVATN